MLRVSSMKTATSAYRLLIDAAKPVCLALVTGILFLAPTGLRADVQIKPYFEFKQPKMLTFAGDVSLDTNGAAPVYSSPSSSYVLGFEGVSQYDGAALGRNAIPPDTMGAVGMTQYFETTNGAYAVFNKATGTRLSLVSDVAFWAAAGQTGANGDTRVMYNAAAQRWITVAFGANTKDLQVAVSDTDDALGTWKSTKFEGYAGLGFGGAIADYPTLALDKNAVYIGTNNFAPAFSGGPQAFRGTTLNVIPLDSLFNGVSPTTTNMKQFVTPFTGGVSDVDRGFTPQGVNSTSAGATGKVLAVSLQNFDSLAYIVNGLSPTSATGASTGSVQMLGVASYTNPGAARQPAATVAANRRIIDALDDRISSSVYEANGRIYALNTVNVTANGDSLDEARIHYVVLDALTYAILDEGNIGSAGYDYYQGSIAVNSYGQVVIGYNRSGLDATTGKISFMAQTFDTGPGGILISTSNELLLKESLVDDYHNGSAQGFASAGRQRWGDYSQVSLDPSDPFSFYLIGQFAREYNNAAGGHPGGTGFSRWGTWIAQIEVAAIPEPGSALTILILFGVVGRRGARRRRI